MPDEGFTELAGPRVALRRFHPGDVAEFVAYRSSVQVARFQSWDAPVPREEGERFVQELAKEHPDTPGAWFQFAVALRPAGQLIGDCAAIPRADDSRQCEIGFTIAPKYQGHGYATEAVRMRTSSPVRICRRQSVGPNRRGPRLSRLWRFRGNALCAISQAVSAETH